MKLGTLSRLRKFFGLGSEAAEQDRKKKKFRSMLLEGLENRQLFATDLALGDIAFTGYQATAPDKVSFVLLKDITSGTVLTVTDNAWSGTALATNEGNSVITFGSSFSAGTQFNYDATRTAGSRWAVGTVATGITEATSSGFALNASGDNVFAYNGSTAPTTGGSALWVSALASNAFLASGTSNASLTYLPSAFTLGTNAKTLGLANAAANENGAMTAPSSVSGTAAQIGAIVNGTGTWTTFTTAGGQAIPPAITFTLTSGTGASLAIAGTSATQAEGNSGSTSFTFTVTRSNNTTGTTTVNYAVTGGATSPADVTDFGGVLPSGSVTFADGETTQVITINVTGDTSVESNEDFVVTLSGASGDASIPTATANGVIQNDDSSFSIAALSASKPEGDTGTTSFTFTVTRSGNLTQSATVDYSTLGSGTNPTDGSDLSGTGTVAFAANQATATVTIDVVGDTTTEQDEAFDVTLANAVSLDTNISASIGTPASATGTILNDDAVTQLAIAANSANKAEGNSATTPFTFTVTRSGDTSGASSATWTVTGSGTNAASTTTDISSALTGTVSFAAGETTQTITVDVIGDTNVELDEGFTVTLSNPSAGVAITANTADGVIVNDDFRVSLPTTAISTIEGNTGTTPVSVTVTRTGDTSIAATVDWAITGTGTNAANAADFFGGLLPNGTLTFGIGDTTQTISFSINGDTSVELNETYTLTLSNLSNGGVIGTATEAGTIVNDDVITLSAGDIALTGYNGTTTVERVSFVVLRDIPSLTAINFTDSGFTASNGQFNTNEGLTSVVFTADVAAGTRFYLEGLALKNFDGTAAAATVTGSASSLSNSGDQVTAYQGNANAPTSILASISSMPYITTGAINNSTSYLPAGLTLGTNAISLGNGTFNGSLNSADTDIGTSVTGSKATILGKVNDINNWTASTETTLTVPPAITFSVTADTPVLSIATSSATALEGNSGTTSFTFTVTRSTITTGSTSVDYSLTGGTADATDFGGALPAGTVSFADGETSKTISIDVVGDTVVEADETFIVTLSNPTSSAVITTASATGTIQNDDSSFSIAPLSASKLEGNTATTSFTFTITRTGNLSTDATVDYAALGSGTNATDASDFSGATTGTVSFLAGSATATITINVVGDAAVEQDETFDVSISDAVGTGAISASIGTPASATGTILNDDAQTLHSIAATDASKAEGNTGTTPFTFTVSRTGDLSSASSVSWTVTGSGTNPADTTDIASPLTGTVSFDIGESSKVITVNVNGDTTIESDEGFTVTLSNPTSGTAISTAAADGLIVNDDLSVAIPTTAISTTEGNSGSTVVSVTVTRTGDTSAATTVAWSIVGSGSNPASADDFLDGVLPSGTVEFAAGDTTKTISFSIAGDTTIEPSEGYTLSLDSTSNGLLGNASEAGTITNDDIFLLQPGDIAFTGYNGTTTIERVSFVVLRDIPTATTILFTDNGYTASGNSGAFNTNEGLTTVLFNAAVPAGTRFYLEGLALKNFDGSAAAATVTGTPSALSNSGDQVTALQGALNAPLSILASISSGSYLTTGSINNSTSYLPTGLTLGTTALSLGNGASNGVLNSADPDIGSSVNGTQVAILSKVNDVSNWVASTATTLTVPPAITFNFGLVTPTVSVPSSVTYSAAPVSLTATADDGTGGYAADTDQSHFTIVSYYDGPLGTGNAISAPTNVGDYSVVVAYAGADETYNAVPSTAINFSITPFALTPIATATSKIYDATTAAAVSISLSGVFAGDTVSGSATGTFDTKNVGAGKTVTVGAITLSGSSASNYSAGSSGQVLADIDPFALTASGTASSKVYDSTTSATVTVSLVGIFAGDTVVGSAVGTFDSKNVGTGKSVSVGTVTLSGTDAANYTVGSAGSTTANITPYALTATATGTNKVYDATAATTVAIQVVGAFSGDVVSATGTATFGNKNVATGKTVTVNSVTLAGADAANYSLAAGFTTTADITSASLSITGLTGNNKAFDGTSVATVSGTATISPLSGDSVTLGGTPTYVFANNGPGTNIAITAVGFTVSGADAANYVLQQPTGLFATITANAAPVISAQAFTISSKSFTDSVVGKVVATDPDAEQTLSYAITAGNSAGAFKINASSGTIQIADATKLPAIPKGSTSASVVLTVSATDNGSPSASNSAAITVILSTTGRNAPFVAPPIFSVAENNKKTDGSVKVGVVKPTASYTGQKFGAFTLGGADAASFAIDAKGTITLATGVSLNYEAKNLYSLTVSVADSVDAAKVTTAALTVNVTNVNEAPVFSLRDRTGAAVDITGGKGTLSVSEKIPTNIVRNGYVIGTLTAADQDQLASTLNYQKDAKGADVVLDKTGAFGFNPTTGAITVVDENKVSYESNKLIKLSFVVTDNPVSGDPKQVVLSTKMTVTVNLNDLNEAPVFDAKSPTVLTVAENNKAGVVIGQVKAKDADSKAAVKQTLVYTIESITDENGDEAAVFVIDAATGKISVPTAGAINFETSKNYTVVVRVTDSGSPGLYSEQTIAVNVTDVNEAASVVLKNASNAAVTSLSLSLASIGSGVPVGQIEVSDVDAGAAGTNSVTFTDGSKGGLSYNATTGVLTIGDKSKLVAGKVYKMSALAVDGSGKPVKVTLKFDLTITA